MRHYDVIILHVTYFCISGIVNTPHRDNLGPSFVSEKRQDIKIDEYILHIRQHIYIYIYIYIYICFLLDIINKMC